jgi:hypothetical protein
MRNARNRGASLSDREAALIKGMLNRGDRQHDIAAWFGVNGGRIAEIASAKEFWWVQPATGSDLPPPGPYFPGQLLARIADLEAALQHR